MMPPDDNTHRQPLVSVVMPIRNEGAFLERTLGSVLAQDYPADRIEVIVADGMSDDGTREAVERSATRNIRTCSCSTTRDASSRRV